MATSVAHTSAPASHHYTTLGLDSRKVAIWAFIGSECMLFVSLISTYLIYKGRSVVGPFPHEAWTDPTTGHVLKPILNIPVTSASTFVLLMSSLFMVLALAAVNLALTPLTTDAGEWLLGQRTRVSAVLQAHADRGEWMIYFSAGLFVVAIALAVLHWLEGRSDRRRTVANVVVAIVALLVGVSSIVTVMRIGDSGAHSVWGRGS